MGITVSRQVITSKISGYVSKITQGKLENSTPQTLDALQLEIQRIEKTISNMATRPSRVVHKNQPPSPLAEHQKIIDLAG